LTKHNSKTRRTSGIGPIVLDLEANGLLNNATHIHCIVLNYVEENYTASYNDECPGKGMSSPVVRAVQHLEMADYIIGHNILGYDLPLIKSIYPFFNPTGIIIDTLLLSRLYHPNLLEIDKQHAWKHMPLQLYGRHSLESYGYRLGEYKGNFAHSTDWKEWTQEMEDYCVQDVKVTTKLWNHFHKYLNGSY
jgi:hypothetical protein